MPLLSGERIRWTGNPAGGLLFMPTDLFVVPFTFIWCGMASTIFWEGGRAFVAQPLPFMLIPFLFVGVGLFMAVGRFGLDIWLRARTSYMVTDRRVVIDRQPPFGRSTALIIRQIADVRLRPGRGSRGTIAFGDGPSILGRRGFGSLVPSLDSTPQLLVIADAASVYALIQRLIDEAPRKDPG